MHFASQPPEHLKKKRGEKKCTDTISSAIHATHMHTNVSKFKWFVLACDWMKREMIIKVDEC